MSITNLFCTPEQGKRLRELVPELTSGFVWGYGNDPKYGKEDTWDVCYADAIPKELWSLFKVTPALTLQELRDVMKKVNNDTIERIDEPFLSIDERVLFEDKVIGCNAPELAAWVIERLEEVER